jgi:predicted PurR-regulated permease PerM
MVQSYMVGLMIEACIVATLDSVGLLLIGIEHAVLFGVLAAVLNLIPYIGGLIATSLPVAIALTSDTPHNAFWVIGLFAFVQLVDNNFLIPTIVASKVKINALVSIIVVIIGGALWSVPGMFLALPMTAILKVICDAADPLKPLGFLLGDNMPPIGKIILKKPNKVKGA